MALRHIASWLPATPEEQQELTAAIAIAQAATPEADGFKIAINQGADFVAVPGPACQKLARQAPLNLRLEFARPVRRHRRRYLQIHFAWTGDDDHRW